MCTYMHGACAYACRLLRERINLRKCSRGREGALTHCAHSARERRSRAYLRQPVFARKRTETHVGKNELRVCTKRSRAEWIGSSRAFVIWVPDGCCVCGRFCVGVHGCACAFV